MIKLKLCCAAAALLTLQLPACSFSANVETLLSPPRLNAEQEQIYQALQSAAGTSVSLKYPKSGERLSAFTVADLNGDGADEAIVFYEVNRSGAEENPLRICLLDQEGGKWRAVKDYATANAEVERIDIEQLGTNERTNIIIRYGMAEGTDHTAEVFHYADGELVRTLSVSYSMLSVRDLNLDGTQELFAVSAAKASAGAAATVYALDAEGTYVQSGVSLPESFTDISRITYGMMPAGTEAVLQPAVYIDGASGSATAQTAVLTYQNSLLTLAYSDSAEGFPNTVRPSECGTADIDGDGEMEIPVQTVFYGYSNAAEASPLSMTNWYVCRNGLLMREYSSYYAAQEGYVFRLPARWERRVTAVQEGEEIVFYEFDREAQAEDGTPILKAPLLRLATVTDPIAAEIMQQEGYMLLRQQNSAYYLGKTETDSNTLAISPSELLFAVQLLT